MMTPPTTVRPGSPDRRLRRTRRTLRPQGAVAGTACFAALSLLAAAPAVAQNAIGSGRALDRNLNPQSGGINPAGPVDDFRSRNLIVTDSVLGGRGFRGSVGYDAVGAFGGETGSDALYQFRRDAAWSDVNLINYGYTYQRFRFGQDVGLVEYARVGEAQSARALAMQEQATQLYQPQDLIDAQVRIDRIAFESQLDTTARSSSEPTIIGAGRAGDVNYLVRSSPFSGLTKTPVNSVGAFIGLTTYDLARIADDTQAGAMENVETRLGEAFRSTYAKLEADSRRVLEPVGGRIETAIPGERIGDAEASGDESATDRPGPSAPVLLSTGEAEFRDIQESIAERYQRLGEEPDDENITAGASKYLDREQLLQLEEDLQQLRMRLAGANDDAAAADDAANAVAGDAPVGTARLPGLDDPTDPDDVLNVGVGDSAGRIKDSLLIDPKRLPRSVAEFGLILRHGQQIERLSSDNTDRFHELLGMAEQSLVEGSYFKAERRFTRALRFTPGHPLATAGLAHAQIGAGLYLSASLTLRSLFSYQPEMIDTRYAPNLIPNMPRLMSAVTKLEERLETQGNRTANGFLLAYVGRLLGERRHVVRGLEVMTEDAPDDLLLPLLREVWLAERGPAVIDPAAIDEDGDVDTGTGTGNEPKGAGAGG